MMLTGTEIFVAIACGIAAGETIGCLIRRYFHRLALADMAFQHRLQIAELAALHKVQRDEIAETILRVKRGGEIVPLHPVRH